MKFNWTDRLTRATAHREFQHDDVIAAFSSRTSLLAEFDVPRDEHGQALDGVLQRWSNDFGFAVLMDDVTKALVTYQAFAERAEISRGLAAA